MLLCYFHSILILQFWNVEISLHFKFTFLHFPSVLLVFISPLISKLNLSPCPFYPTRKHMKISRTYGLR